MALIAGSEEEQRLAYTLAYNEVSMGSDGQVLTDDKKRKEREKKGYCLECRGPPVLLYTIKKSRMNPLFTTKKPRTMVSLCKDGICFACNPNKDPNKNKNKNKFFRGHTSPVPSGGRRSVPVITSQVLNNVQQRSPKPSPNTTPLSSPTLTRRTSEPPSQQDISTIRGEDIMSSPSVPSRKSLPILGSPTASRKSAPPLPPLPPIDITSTGSEDTDQDLAEDSKPSPAREIAPPNVDPTSRQYSSDSVLPRMSMMDEPSRRPARQITQSSRRESEPSHQSESLARHSNQLSESMRNERMDELMSERMSESSQPTRTSSSSHRPSGASQQYHMSDSFDESSTEFGGSTEFGSSGHFSAPPNPSITEEDVQVIITRLDSLLSEMLQVPGAEVIVAESLVGALREHHTQEDVLIYCFKTIWESCKDNDNMKREIMKLDAPEDIVKAMKRFHKSAVLQEVGCGATWALAIRAENRGSFIRLGSCALIIAAMDRFKTHENVVSSAVGAARTLSPEDDAREPLRIAEGSKMVARAMRAHPTSSIIQRDGCAFLSNAAVDMKSQYVTVVPKEELETVIQAMHHHRHDPAVVAGACFALKNYTVDENNCRTLRKIENAMELIQHAAGFIASPECMEDAEDILESMQFAQTLDNSIEDEAYATFSSTVEQQINLPGFVNRILEFVEENDWSPRLTALGLQTYGRLALSDSDQKDRVYSQTNLSRIVHFAKNLKEEQSVCLEACNLFAILGGDESKRPMLTSVGACDVIFQSLSFQRNESLIRSSLQALELLASTNAGNCISLIRHKKKVIREALEANQTSDSIMISAMTILSLVE